uniref:Uncharacterized protein n=1 Tax=Panagrolaimus sp. JU765 TaxID=591449 RepID=A0AC34RBX5_9BILA
MNLNGPGFARKAASFVFCFLIFGIVRSQHESHEGTNGKKHLQGIRRLAIHRISEARPVQVPSTGPKRYFSNYAPARSSAEEKRTIAWPQWHRPQTSRRIAPFAVSPVLESRESRELIREEVNFERRLNLLPVNVAVHAAPTQIFHHSSPKPPNPEVNELTHVLAQEEMERKRMERLQARWRKIGFPRGGFRPVRPYNRMKMPHFAEPVAWTHVPTTEKTEPTTAAPTTTPTTTIPSTTPPTTTPETTTSTVTTTTETLQSRIISLPEVIKPKKEETMIRRINKHGIHIQTPGSVPPRAYGQRRFFTGKILEEPETPEIPPSRPILVSHTSEGLNVDDGPSIQEEQFAARGDQNAKSYPLAIPELAPLSSRENDRRPLPPTKFEEPTAFLTRHKSTPGSQPFQSLRPLPLPEMMGEQNIQVEPPPPPPNHVPPKVTSWGDEDFSESITEESGLGSGLGVGDSASGLGAEVGTPPPGFKEAFGLNGATTELTTTTVPETTTARGPTGDGFGPPVFPGAAIPPPVVGGISTGGGAAGIPPMPAYRMVNENENEATTVKPSALLSVLNKADEGFNQAITHFERGTPIESAAIDILEVALGSERLDSQAKLLGHVDRTFGLDNLQRLQRWANTGGAFDMLKEQFGKMLKNYKPPEPTVTLPPQLEYLFAPSG